MVSHPIPLSSVHSCPPDAQNGLLKQTVILKKPDKTHRKSFILLRALATHKFAGYNPTDWQCLDSQTHCVLAGHEVAFCERLSSSHLSSSHLSTQRNLADEIQPPETSSPARDGFGFAAAPSETQRCGTVKSFYSGGPIEYGRARSSSHHRHLVRFRCVQGQETH